MTTRAIAEEFGGCHLPDLSGFYQVAVLDS
jgi:hypothetical protein